IICNIVIVLSEIFLKTLQILDLFSNLKIHQRNKKPPLTPPRPPLTPPKEGNKKMPPKEGNKKTPPKEGNKKMPTREGNKKMPPREGNYSPPSEGAGMVSYRLAKRSNIKRNISV
ncbi:MAG: hypothetical protein LBC74_16230, partial [Planctomycetaceae bacterium]|nr:hypothetical protein [Planctomycetaceae bacterium]